MSDPDPKPDARIKDPDLLDELHRIWTSCALEELGGCDWRLGLHHIDNHPRHDVRPNLIMLCGSGTTGHHGLVEARHSVTCTALWRLLHTQRTDTLAWLAFKHKGADRAEAWLERKLVVGVR